jgi:hypothetical protein
MSLERLDFTTSVPDKLERNYRRMAWQAWNTRIPSRNDPCAMIHQNLLLWHISFRFAHRPGKFLINEALKRGVPKRLFKVLHVASEDHSSEWKHYYLASGVLPPVIEGVPLCYFTYNMTSADASFFSVYLRMLILSRTCCAIQRGSLGSVSNILEYNVWSSVQHLLLDNPGAVRCVKLRPRWHTPRRLLTSSRSRVIIRQRKQG